MKVSREVKFERTNVKTHTNTYSLPWLLPAKNNTIFPSCLLLFSHQSHVNECNHLKDCLIFFMMFSVMLLFVVIICEFLERSQVNENSRCILPKKHLRSLLLTLDFHPILPLPPRSSILFVSSCFFSIPFSKTILSCWFECLLLTDYPGAVRFTVSFFQIYFLFSLFLHLFLFLLLLLTFYAFTLRTYISRRC